MMEMGNTFDQADSKDAIIVSGLELSCFIGVPDAERSEPQRLTLEICLVPARGFRDLGDDLTRTVDYFALTRRLKRLAMERSRKLIETLADEVCACVLAEFPVRSVKVELRKYILADTEFVAVRLERSAGD